MNDGYIVGNVVQIVAENVVAGKGRGCFSSWITWRMICAMFDGIDWWYVIWVGEKMDEWIFWMMMMMWQVDGKISGREILRSNPATRPLLTIIYIQISCQSLLSYACGEGLERSSKTYKMASLPSTYVEFWVQVTLGSQNFGIQVTVWVGIVPPPVMYSLGDSTHQKLLTWEPENDSFERGLLSSRESCFDHWGGSTETTDCCQCTACWEELKP